MAACEVMRVRTEASAGIRGTLGNRLSWAVRPLSPTVTVCHDLPRSVNFSRRVWRAAFRRNCGLVKGHDAMFMAGRVLGRIDNLNQAESRSVASDLLQENEGEGLRGPVTVCQINFAEGHGAIMARPFRALRFIWRPVPRALPWAAMGRTFGAPAEICSPKTTDQRLLPRDCGSKTTIRRRKRAGGGQSATRADKFWAFKWARRRVFRSTGEGGRFTAIRQK